MERLLTTTDATNDFVWDLTKKY